MKRLGCVFKIVIGLKTWYHFHMKKRYELTDEQWERLRDILPAKPKAQRGRPAKDDRQMLNAMLWVVRSGAPWRDLPGDYGPWKSVYTRFRRWEKAGLFDQMLEIVSGDPDDESVMIDASIIRVHQHGTGAKGGNNFRRLGVHEAG
jgi:transposase